MVDLWNSKMEKVAAYVDAVGDGIDILSIYLKRPSKNRELAAAGNNAKKKEEIERKRYAKQTERYRDRTGHYRDRPRRCWSPTDATGLS